MIFMGALAKGMRSMTEWCWGSGNKPIHICPHHGCGAPVSRMVLIAGGLNKRGKKIFGKMVILCRECRRSHTYKGVDREATELYLQLYNNTKGVQRSRMLKGAMALRGNHAF